MKSALISFVISIINFYCVVGELEFYPDFRRPETVSKWENEQRAEEYALEQFTKYLQEQQRRLALQQEPEPDFTYSVPVRPLDDTPEFAVAPPDPRYYQNSQEEDDAESDREEEEDDQNFEPLEPAQQNKFVNQEQPSYQNHRSANNEEIPYQSNFPSKNSFSDYPSLTSNHFQPFQYNKLTKQHKNQQKQTNQETNQETSQETKQKPTTSQQTDDDDNIILKTRTEEQLGSTHKLRESDLLTLTKDGYQYLDQAVAMTPVRTAKQDDTAGVYIIAVVAGISAATTVALIAFAIGWYNLQKNVKNATDVEYPAYGVTGPNKDVSPTGDRRLAQSAQMYHYQHQKQQIIAMESRAGATVRHGSMSEAESDEENEEGDYTVYECPGLAPAGEMEVKNPLFQDDPTPASTTTKDEKSLQDQK